MVWGEICRRATLLSDLGLVLVVCIALNIPWYDGYHTKRTIRYGAVLHIAFVLLCAIPLRWGIAVIFLLLDCKDNRQFTHVV